jgi:hypothetical protein
LGVTGLLDFNRNLQVFHQVFDTVHINNGLIPLVESRAYWDNQTVEVRLQAAHYSDTDWTKNKLQWELSGVVGVERIEPIKNSAAELGSIRIPMSRVQATRLLTLKLTLINSTDREIISNHADLLVLPSNAAQARYSGRLSVMTYEGTEAAVIQQLNYNVETQLRPDTDLVVTNCPSDDSLQWVRQGGSMLFISEDEYSPFWQRGRGGASGGSWIKSFSWMRPEVYPHLKIDNPLNLPLRRVMPSGNIMGFICENPLDNSDVLAGQMTGWVQRPAIHTVQFRYGKGRVIMTTYALLESLRFGDVDPVGVVMFNDLIDYLGSDRCQPKLSMDC